MSAHQPQVSAARIRLAIGFCSGGREVVVHVMHVVGEVGKSRGARESVARAGAVVSEEAKQRDAPKAQRPAPASILHGLRM
jgi:hypothetical protein